MNNGTSNVIICDFNGITNKWIVRKIDYYKSSDRFTAIILPELYTAQQKEIPIDLPKDSSDKDILRIVSMRLQEYLGQRFPANASFEMFREPIIRTSALCCKLNALA